MALDGGPDGLGIVRRLLRQAQGRLQPHGVVLLEIGGLREAIEREFVPARPGEWLPILWWYATDGTGLGSDRSAMRAFLLPGGPGGASLQCADGPSFAEPRPAVSANRLVGSRARLRVRSGGSGE